LLCAALRVLSPLPTWPRRPSRRPCAASLSRRARRARVQPGPGAADAAEGLSRSARAMSALRARCRRAPGRSAG